MRENNPTHAHHRPPLFNPGAFPSRFSCQVLHVMVLCAMILRAMVLRALVLRAMYCLP